MASTAFGTSRASPVERKTKHQSIHPSIQQSIQQSIHAPLNQAGRNEDPLQGVLPQNASYAMFYHLVPPLIALVEKLETRHGAGQSVGKVIGSKAIHRHLDEGGGHRMEHVCMVLVQYIHAGLIPVILPLYSLTTHLLHRRSMYP